MKAAQRLPWRGLSVIEANRSNRHGGYDRDYSYIPSICGECKFFYSYSGGWWGEDDWGCDHPLERVSGNMDCTYDGGDCWGFRPKRRLQEALDEMGVTKLEAVASWNMWHWANQARMAIYYETMERKRRWEEKVRFAELTAERIRGNLTEEQFRKRATSTGDAWTWIE